MHLAAAALAGVVGLAALTAGSASSASSRSSVDTYITGKVIGRIPGRNLALVEIAWAYKCLGDKLGESTYQWTLKLVRRAPKPERTTTLGEGTTKKGSMRLRLPPGQYLPIADPFFCETERGAGSDKPEVGAPFEVPDYCAWKVTAAKGEVQLETGAAVKLAKAGSSVRPGETIVTPAAGSATLVSNGADGQVVTGVSTRLGVSAKGCSGKGAWRLQLSGGSVTATVPPSADTTRTYQVATANATATARARATWRVQYAAAGPRTTVKALAGAVVVAGRGRSAVTVTKGLSTVVTGSAAPSKPAP
jgi:hypothetical protein